MVNRKFGLGILALALVFGMMAIACDDGSSNGGGSGGRTDSALNGTWVAPGERLTLNNGDFEIFEFGTLMVRGTYTTSGNSMTIRINQISGAMFGLPGLQSRSDLSNALSGLLPASELNMVLDEIFSPMTGTYTLSGNTLTITMQGETTEYTRN